MTTTSIHLNTKDQLLHCFGAWGVNEAVPGNGKKVVIGFPPGASFRLATIVKSDKRSTYGESLYQIELSNP